MSNEQEDAAYYLRKAEEFRQKAKAANELSPEGCPRSSRAGVPGNGSRA